MEFQNTYGDRLRAAAYDELEFGGTYYIAFRDLPRLLRDHVTAASRKRLARTSRVAAPPAAMAAAWD